MIGISILNALKIWVSEKLLNINSLHIDEVLAELFVLLFPYVVKNEKFENNDPLENYVKLLRGLRNNYKKRYDFDTLSRDSLTRIFVQYWNTVDIKEKRKITVVDNFEDKKNKLSIVGVYDDGYLYACVDTNIFKTYAFKITKPTLIDSYNTRNITDDELGELSMLMKENHANSNRSKVTERNNIVLDQTDNRLSSVFCRIFISNDHFNSLFPYVWKLKISQSDYVELKKSLKSIFSNTGNRVGDLINRHSRELVIYVAEWFKREYIGGNNGDNNRAPLVFSEIGIDKNVASRLCENLPESLLYSAETNSRYLDSLYALGGFPLKKIKDFEKIFFKIYELRQTEDFSEELWSNIVDEFDGNSRAFIQSLNNIDGSFRQYVEYLWSNNDLPIHEEDKSLSGYQKIKSSLDQGREKAEKNKFRLDWEAECHNNVSLSLLLTFQNNLDNAIDRSIIPQKTAESWGVYGPCLQVIVKNGDNKLRTLTFFRRKDGNYESKSSYEKYVLASDEEISDRIGITSGNNKIDFGRGIKLICGNYVQDFNISNPIKFRFEDWFRWTSSRTKGALAVYFPFFNRLELQNIVEDTIEVGNSLWMPVTNKISCKYDGKEMDLDPFIYGEIVVEPDLTDYPNIHFKDGKYVFCNVNDEEKNVLLIKSIDKLNVYLKNKTSELLTSDLYTIKKLNDVESGYCKLEISINDNSKKRKEIDCYFVDNDFEVARIPMNSDIDFFKATKRVCDRKYHDLSYDVYVGDEGLYDFETKYKLSNSSGVLKFLNRYAYRDDKGYFYSVYKELADKAVMCIYQDVYAKRVSLHYKESFELYPFSLRTIECDNEEFRIPLKKNNLELLNDCRFYYCAFDNLDEVREIQIEIKHDNNRTYGILNFESKGSEGMIFQSLQERNLRPNFYLKPYFVSSRSYNDYNAKTKSDIKKIDINDKYIKLANGDYDSFNNVIKAFEFACKHNLYFVSLNWLCALVHKPNASIVASFYIRYVDYCKKNGKCVNFEGLHKLAHELLFDWWIVPMDEWHKHSKELILALLSSKPVVSQEEECARNSLAERIWDNQEFKDSKKYKANANNVARNIRNAGKKKKENIFYQSDSDWSDREVISFSFIDLKNIFENN